MHRMFMTVHYFHKKQLLLYLWDIFGINSPPKTESLQIKFLISFFIFLLKTYIVGTR